MNPEELSTDYPEQTVRCHTVIAIFSNGQRAAWNEHYDYRNTEPHRAFAAAHLENNGFADLLVHAHIVSVTSFPHDLSFPIFI